jgi:TPR repeat protein
LYKEALQIKKSNPEEHKRKLILAAEQGFNLALYELGWYHRHLSKSLKNERTDLSKSDIARQLEENYKTAFTCFNKAANLGLPSAQLEVAYCYKRGEGIEKDLEKAIQIFKTTKDPKADYELGFHYEKGEGVEVDATMAFTHWKYAAKRHMSKAEYRVGICYLYGKGTDRDLYRAKKFLTRAKEKGSFEATAELHNLETLIIQKQPPPPYQNTKTPTLSYLN